MITNIKQYIENKDYSIIELGPGDKKYDKNSIGIDICEKDSVDYIADLRNGLVFLGKNSIDVIYAFHFLEHVDDLEFFLTEVYRVLKPGGSLIASVPHFSNPYFYSDYTHKSFWGLYTICYFSKQQLFKREIPKYYNSLDFSIEYIKLNFRSPFRIRNKIKQIFQYIFNINRYMQELYEENFVYLVPCYEISFKLKKL